ncbi:hypothetical protein TNCV_4471901 [Trichonephila clavipes]|uniref:Uncharacterized protein n=1 Tax=Trichonephila clavipes TaxID=2585209 RepID=A0A8X6SCV5_TRICX|nr:hypothetical protein TNCV_4471901 [Trichonephila clavipes]
MSHVKSRNTFQHLSEIAKGRIVACRKCSSPVIHRGCNFSTTMISTPSIVNAASVVAQSKKVRVPGLGRGPGSKSFEMRTNCSSEAATPAHILERLGLTKQDIADDSLLVLDFLKVYDVMDLV